MSVLRLFCAKAINLIPSTQSETQERVSREQMDTFDRSITGLMESQNRSFIKPLALHRGLSAEDQELPHPF